MSTLKFRLQNGRNVQASRFFIAGPSCLGLFLLLGIVNSAAGIGFGAGAGVVRKDQDKSAELERYKHALTRYRQIGDTESEGNVLVQMALIYEHLDEPENALEHYALVLPLLRPAGDDGKRAAILVKLGELNVAMNRYDLGCDYLKQALLLWRKIHDYRFEAQTHITLGKAYHFLGNDSQAFEHFGQSLPLFEKLGDLEATANVYILLGLVAPTHKDVLDYYSRALAAFRKLGLKKDEATTLGAIASFYSSLDMRASLRYYEQALALWETTKEITEQAKVLEEMGSLYRWVDDGPNAAASYQKALSIWRSTGNHIGEANVTMGLGWNSYWGGNSRDALQHFNNAANLWRQKNKPMEEAFSLSQVSFIQAQMGQRREALDTLSRIGSLVKNIDPNAHRNAFLSYFTGLTYLLLNDPQQALKYWQQELDIYKARADQSGEARALFVLGWRLEREGEPQKALNYYLQSIALREKIIEGARIEELKRDLAGISAGVYEQAVLLSFKLGNYAQAFELSERARARALLDQLGNTRLDLRHGANADLVQQEEALRREVAKLQEKLRTDFARPAQQLNTEETQVLAERLVNRQTEYGDLLARLKASNPQYASLRAVNPIDLKTLRDLLDERTTLLSYFITSERSLAFIITRDSFHVVELCANGRCVSERELTDAITQFRGFADLRDPHPPALKKLYAWLIEPVKKYLNTDRICVVPHGVLHYLPFDALTNGEKFLSESHALHYLPSASVWPLIRQQRTVAANSLLALSQSNVQGLPVLRYADETARKIAERYNTQALTGSAATESAFRAGASATRNVFLAAHGKLNASSPLFSSIFLAPDADNDGALEVHEVYELDLRSTDLIVLSGCETHLGKLSRGDEVVGLNRAFLHAGAPTVIASLWSVRESPTGELMKAFYEYRKSGMDKVKALQKAQSLVRLSHPHPYYWTSFVLTGEP